MKKKAKEKINTVSAKGFVDESGSYVFPFVSLDKVTDGSSLGRIEWHIEPIMGKKKKGRYYIEKLLVFATQTRDERYRGKTFEIPCFSAAITADSLRRRDSYLHFVWKAQICEVHKTIQYSAYPKDEHTKLVINAFSSFSIDIDFI